MILYQPLLLTNEFVTPIFCIVLAGVLIVEYIAYSRSVRSATIQGVRTMGDENAWYMHKKKCALIAFLGIVIFVGGNVIVEEFIVLDRFSGLSLITQTVYMIALLGFVYYLVKQRWGRTPKTLLRVLIVVGALTIIFDVLDTIWHVPFFVLAHATMHIFGVVILYLFIMQYLIINAEQEEKHEAPSL